MPNPYQSAIDPYLNRGISIVSMRKTLFGCVTRLSYPLGGGEIGISIAYSSLGKSATAEMIIPLASCRAALRKEYDRVFPEEVNAWGKSTPALPLAIRDYMRGQTHSGNLAELSDDGSNLRLLYHARCAVGGVAGFSDALRQISFEFRKGTLHADVLFHMFG